MSGALFVIAWFCLSLWAVARCVSQWTGGNPWAVGVCCVMWFIGYLVTYVIVEDAS